MSSKQPQFRRILLKLSGEALMGEQDAGVDPATCERIAEAIKEVTQLGIQLGIVIGGGNIFRGAHAQAFGFLRTPSDHIGMLATVINGILMQQALEKIGISAKVMSAVPCSHIVSPYHWQEAISLLTKGSTVIFVGGTGNPYFTTDTAAALRACEINADILFKATKVDGVYDTDPLKNAHAIKYESLSYSEMLSKQLNVMDATAIALCRENKLPIGVFDIFEKGALLKAVLGEPIGSIIKGD